LAVPSVDGMLSWVGNGRASSNLTRQWPELLKYVPELENCFQATVNVDLLIPVLVVNPQRAIPPFEWKPGHIEGFGMLEIKFEWPIETEPFQAWVYLAQRSFHRYNAMRAELITKHISLLPARQHFTEENRRCRLHYSFATGYLV
jgi:hypothetical protein